MKNNKIYDEILNSLSKEQLEKMIKQKKNDIKITELYIAKKEIINKQLEERING